MVCPFPFVCSSSVLRPFVGPNNGVGIVGDLDNKLVTGRHTIVVTVVFSRDGNSMEAAAAAGREDGARVSFFYRCKTRKTKKML